MCSIARNQETPVPRLALMGQSVMGTIIWCIYFGAYTEINLFIDARYTFGVYIWFSSN